MANSRVGGIILFKINGELFQAKGAFTYNIGKPKKEAVIGADRVHGFKETVVAPKIEGALTDSDELDLEALVSLRDATVTLELANGKVIVIRGAWYAADADVDTEEGEIPLMIQGLEGEEIR